MPQGKYSASDVAGQYTDADVAPSGVAISAQPSMWSIPGLKSRAYALRNSAVDQLPGVGGIVGGLIGSGAGPGGTIVGAAAGGGLGEDARQALEEHLYPNEKKMTPRQAVTGMAKQAAIQAGSELIPRIVGNIVRPATAVEKLSYVGKLGAGEDVAPAMEELTRTERMPGNQIKTVGDYLGVLDQTKKRIGTEVSAALKTPVKTQEGKPLGSLEADTTSISDRIANLASKHLSEKETNPTKLTMFKNRALSYQTKPHTFEWLFDRRQVLNDELNRFYSLSTPGEKATYLNQHPDFEADKAEADAIRDLVYPQMDKAAGKPAGYYAGLQKKYGSLIGVENATKRNVEKLAASGRVERGAPITERVSGSSYISGEGRPGISLHRLHNVLSKPNPIGKLDSAAKSAFGHSIPTKVGAAIGSDAGVGIMSAPIRYLLDEQEAPRHPTLSPASPVQ